MLTLLTVALTGGLVALGPEWSGPLFISKSAAHAIKEVHEAAAWTLPVLIALHVAGVLLSSFLEKQNLVAGNVVLQVSDTGPGIGPGERAQVFERFFRGRAAEGQPGSGLGLTVVKALVEAEGAKVEFSAPEGGGARFTVTF